MLPIEINRSKPYLTTPILPAGDSLIRAKFLIDSGAGLALVIHPDTSPDLKVPEKVIPGSIGLGLGGKLEGVLGLLPKLYLGEASLNDVPVHYQEISNIIDTTFLNGRNGIIGNRALERFTVTLDYYREILYLEPNNLVRKPFPVNKSGMLVIASGPDLKTFLVQAVMEGSPADQAGIIPGDVILGINYLSFRFIDLDTIYQILSGKEGKTIRVRIDREGQKQKAFFSLKNLI